MTFEVSSMSLSIRRTRNNYLHYDDIVYTEQPRMRLLISMDQKQLSALWWHLKCHQWAYRYRRTRNSYLHYDVIWSVINELIDSKDQKILSALWWYLTCHHMALYTSCSGNKFWKGDFRKQGTHPWYGYISDSTSLSLFLSSNLSRKECAATLQEQTLNIV